MLITGSGYSSTGFFSKAFSAAGYPVGHEEIGEFGTSSWMEAAPSYGKSSFHFEHVFLLVRHPLKRAQSIIFPGF